MSPDSGSGGCAWETVATVIVPGHDHHVLKVTMFTLFADRTIVRVIGHQPFHNVGAEGLGLVVRNRDPAAVLGRVMHDMFIRPFCPSALAYCLTAH